MHCSSCCYFPPRNSRFVHEGRLVKAVFLGVSSCIPMSLGLLIQPKVPCDHPVETYPLRNKTLLRLPTQGASGLINPSHKGKSRKSFHLEWIRMTFHQPKNRVWRDGPPILSLPFFKGEIYHPGRRGAGLHANMLLAQVANFYKTFAHGEFIKSIIKLIMCHHQTCNSPD